MSVCGNRLVCTTDPISLDDCCKDGKERGQESQDCTSLPLISESTTCRIAQEQCCTAVLEDNICTSGINVAKDQGSCDALLSSSTCETKTAKTCCECCLLGRAAQERGLSCDLTLAVWYQCGLVSRACCVDRSPNSDGKPAPGENKQTWKTSEIRAFDECTTSCFNGSCACLEGYKLKADAKTCEGQSKHHSCILPVQYDNVSVLCVVSDIDECETGTHNCGAELECQNTAGSFRCRPRVQCGVGFIQDALGSCIDINECLSVTGPCPSGHMCFNTVGSYTCQRHSVTCGRGYHLNADGSRCVGTETITCALPTGGHICSYRCHNTPGSFLCTCPATGYTLAPNGRSCQDIDECVTSTHSCSESESCFNIQGGYKCLNFDCPANYRRSGDTRPRVDRADFIRCVKSCQPNDISCMLNPILSFSHTAISLPTFREFNKPEEIVFLRSPTPSHLPHMDSPEIVYDILEGNVQNSFDIIKRLDHGMIVGVVRQVKPLVGPVSSVLKLAMNYVTNGVVSHRNIINVHIYVSEFWF
uniref:Fibulin 1 n=1 Tax=Cyprinus carpio TaxID=7962 RepID=A0A8C2KUR0_CYPCA